MNDFTFLTEKQVFGDNRLEIFEKYGTKCAITDFSILLGGGVSEDEFIKGLPSLKNRSCAWWTRTPASFGSVNVVDEDGSRYNYGISTRDIGARPAIPYSSIKSKCSNKSINNHGILEVEYGEYPQTVVLDDVAKVLESEYSKGTLKKTGKSYTTDSTNIGNNYSGFQPTTHIEYEYNGKKYIRFVVKENSSRVTLSNRREKRHIDVCWIEVEPIKWLIDEKNDIALSKNVIFAGVKFEHHINNTFQIDFYDTNIKKFMDNYFSKEIISSNLNDLSQGLSENQRTNTYGLNFERVSEEEIIKGAIESGIAVFLHGPSSEGKSSRVKKIDPNCTIIYLRNATPDSLNGKSVYNSETGEMIDIKPAWLKKLEEKCESEPDKLHIVFFDEITNALPSIQGAAFNIVLDKEVNGIWKLPENARVVAAGNDMKDSLAANELAEPLFNRFAHVYIKTTVESWLKWASENNIHPAICAYIAFKREDALRSKYDGEKPNADPRKWEMASKMLYATGKPEMLRALVGEDIANEFVMFCKQRVITLEDVLNENYTENDLKLNTSEIYLTVVGLSQVDEANFIKVREFVLKLGGEPCRLFESLWAHGDESRLEIITEARLKSSKGGKGV